MYRTCLHCHASLGDNDVIPHFGVGRRLAFDPGKGRLWAVCTRCRRWNLAPIEERWEAIEECEREFRGTRLRASTDNIALARIPAGLDLIRIGSPKLRELAAWRYGAALYRRWLTRGLPMTVVGGGAVYVLQTLGQSNLIGFGATMGMMALVTAPVLYAQHRNSRVRVLLPDGRVTTVRHRTHDGAALEPEGDSGWSLRLKAGEDVAVATGNAATHSLRGILTAVNFAGARRPAIDSAIAMLHDAGDARTFIRRVAIAGRGTGTGNVAFMPPEVQLGLEMALHENSERRALEGELAVLHEEWQLAEEVARIADDMFLPAAVQERLSSLKESR